MDNAAYVGDRDRVIKNGVHPVGRQSTFVGAEQSEKSESTLSDPTKLIGVIGTGDYGRAISSRLVKSGYRVHIGSRDPNRNSVKKLVRPTGAHLMNQDDAASSAETLIIAVGRDHYDELPVNLLNGKTLVDVSNNTEVRKGPHYRSNAEYLQQLIPDAKVVKGFNVLSAYSLESGGIQGSKEVYIASDFAESKLIVSSIIREMGFIPIDWGVLSAARDIEDVPLKLMPSWKRPTAVVFGLFVFLWLIALLQFQICRNIASGKWNEHWQHVTLKNFNRVIAILALWTLSFCYLPGLVAAYIQLWWGTKYRRFPNWLDQWLKMRKQLGLLMLAIASVHGCISLGFLSPQTVGNSVYEQPEVVRIQAVDGDQIEEQEMKIYNYEFTWTGGLFLTFAALAMCLAVILGVSSLPSVTAGLTWREFNFIQSKLGWVLLVISSLHDIFLAYDFMFLYWGCFDTMPIGPQYALYPPFICIVLKLPLLLPPVDKYLTMIRKGYNRRPKKVESA